MPQKRILSFKYALEGFLIALKDEPNLKFHLFTAGLTIIGGIFFNITKLEWIILLLCIALVISLELTNTAIEEIVDSFTDKAHPGAKIAKDVASAAVLTVAIISLIIGLLVFIPYLNQLITPTY